MKRTGKIFVSMTSLGVLLNNAAYAATEVVEESKEGLPTKYIFMGIAFLVIVLLLFLGYKMDTKGSETTTKVSHKSEKTRQKLSAKAEEIQQNSGSYEADNEVYEDDGEIFDNDDLNDSIEYADDEEEDSLYSAATEEEPFGGPVEEPVEEEPVSGFSTSVPEEEPVVVDSEEPELETEIEPELEEEEATGEEFDTSIIDGLDDEEEIVEPKKSFDETMLFNNSDFSASGSSLEDEIDNLDNIDDSEIKLIGDEEDDDSSFVEDLKSFEKPESSFAGFSVAPAEDKMEEFNDNEEEIVEEDLGVDEETTTSDPVDKEFVSQVESNLGMNSDFLSQMEANLQKNKEDRKSAKKEIEEKKETKYTKKTTKTTKKKDDK